MKTCFGWWVRSALAFLIVGGSWATANAQNVSGLTFDVSVTTGDSASGTTQTGEGWIAGQHSRVDLRGAVLSAQSLPGMSGENVTLIVQDSAGTPFVAMIDHDGKKVMYPSKMMAMMREMMASLGQQPSMMFKVANVTVDTLGPGETISGFTTKRFRMKAEITVSMEMMGVSAEETMHMDTEGDYSEELSEFMDPLQNSRGFQSFLSAFPFVDSAAANELSKITRAVPRGLPLRQIDRMKGASEGGVPVAGSVTVLSNIKRAEISLSVFAIPPGYTELEMPGMPGHN